MSVPSLSSADPALGQALLQSAQHTSAAGLPCAAAAFPAPSPSHLALLCCARYHRRLLGRDFGFLGFLPSLCMEPSLELLQPWALCELWGARGSFSHFVFLACAAGMFWSTSCSVLQSVRLVPGLGSCAGWFPLPVMLCSMVPVGVPGHNSQLHKDAIHCLG